MIGCGFVLASVAFINTGKNRGFFSRNQCHYGHLLSEFFGSSCAPGALDLARDPQASLESLCSLCRAREIVTGPAVLSVEHHVSPPLIRGELFAASTQNRFTLTLSLTNQPHTCISNVRRRRGVIKWYPIRKYQYRDECWK